ncbi:amidohydrolase family protein [Hyphobacterium sp. CCMP332]|nr:amidohydrolase family protein [Hyphobacterium sp. CCMP332]
MKNLLLIFIAFLLLTACANRQGNNLEIDKDWEDSILVVNDHHVHIMSPNLIALWKKMGIPFSKNDNYYSNVDTIIATNGANYISLISMAYVYASTEFGGGTDNITENIRLENDFLAKAKSRFPESIKAFYGVDPLHESAIEEIERCHKKLKLDGIKLHFNASQVYLTEPEHLAKIKEVFVYASFNQIPILLHFDNSHPKFGKTDVEILANSVLSQLNYVNLQIAHFGTSGGFNKKTKIILDSFIDLFEKNHPISKHRIVFDISGVGLDKEADGVSKLTENQFRELSDYCRKLGFEKIVFGTDYPLYKSVEYFDLLKRKLNLTEQEITELLKIK